MNHLIEEDAAQAPAIRDHHETMLVNGTGGRTNEYHRLRVETKKAAQIERGEETTDQETETTGTGTDHAVQDLLRTMMMVSYLDLAHQEGTVMSHCAVEMTALAPQHQVEEAVHRKL